MSFNIMAYIIIVHFLLAQLRNLKHQVSTLHIKLYLQAS